MMPFNGCADPRRPALAASALPASAFAASVRYVQSSATMRPSRSNWRGIHSFLEGFHTEPAYGIEKSFVRSTPFDIHVQQPRDRFRHVGLRHRRPDHRAQRCIGPGGAPDGDLVPLLAALIHAENADVSHVMV